MPVGGGGSYSFDDIEYARSMRYSGKRRPGYIKQKQHQHEGKQKKIR